MLERNSFLLLGQKSRSSEIYSILDGHCGELVGAVRQRPGLLGSTLRMLSNRLPSQLDVLEQPDDSLVFTIRWTGFLFSSHVEVCDAMDAAVGSFSPHALTHHGNWTIRDKFTSAIATLSGQAAAGEYHFMDVDGAEPLACVSRHTTCEAEPGKRPRHTAEGCLLTMNMKLDDQPLTKMLLLSATLVAEKFSKRWFPLRGLNSLR